MVKSRKVKDTKPKNKKTITSAITPNQLVGETQSTEEDLWEHNNKFKKYPLAGLCHRMCFLMTKCGILRGE